MSRNFVHFLEKRKEERKGRRKTERGRKERKKDRCKRKKRKKKTSPPTPISSGKLSAFSDRSSTLKRQSSYVCVCKIDTQTCLVSVSSDNVTTVLVGRFGEEMRVQGPAGSSFFVMRKN